MAYLPLPPFISLKLGTSDGGYLCYLKEPEQLVGYVQHSRDYYVSNELTKIEVETSKINTNYVHLRFCHTNKYWAASGDTTTSLDFQFLACTSNKPEEDSSKWSCTMFEPIMYGDDRISFRHVQSGRFVQTYNDTSDYRFRCAYVNSTEASDESYSFRVADWDTLVIMPKNVAFKGYNNGYLKGVWNGYHPYLQFASNDPNEEISAHEVIMNVDGNIRIISKHFGKFWRRSPDWIWADSTDTDGSNINTLFWPVKAKETGDETNTIGLLNLGNNRFCTSLTADDKTDCLNASAETVTTRARLIVEELVSERSITDVTYHFDDARIYDESVKIVGSGTGKNSTQTDSSINIIVSFEDSRSTSFSRNLSFKVGVKTSIKTGVPFIAEGGIEVSAEIEASLEWNKTNTETTKVEVSYLADVPARSIASVNYLAKTGTCDVPFSYIQRDRRSSDGSILQSEEHDGIYKGANYYSFYFDQPEIKPLPEDMY